LWNHSNMNSKNKVSVIIRHRIILILIAFTGRPLSTLSPPTPFVLEGWNLAGIILSDGSKSVDKIFEILSRSWDKISFKIIVHLFWNDFEPSLWGLFLSNFSLLRLKVEEETEVMVGQNKTAFNLILNLNCLFFYLIFNIWIWI